MESTTNLLGIIGYITSGVLTILILSYAFKDNPLYKLAIHIFIGAVSGYAGAVALRDVLIPQFIKMSIPQFFIPAILVILLMLKANTKTSKYGDISSALLLGVGAAIAVIGSIQGTLLPFVSNSQLIFSPDKIQEAMQNEQTGMVISYILQGLIILVGMITTLGFFHFSARSSTPQTALRPPLLRGVAKIGRGFIAITFGVIFAGIYSAALTALVERTLFIINLVEIFKSGVN